MNGLSNLKLVSRESQKVNDRLETFFVETHELNCETWNQDLIEYFAYGFDCKSFSPTHFTDIVHHTVLSLMVF